MTQHMQFRPTQTLPTILCCLCGAQIESNPSNMCVNCLRNQVDISEGIPKQLTITYCKLCGKYLQPPNHWVQADLESRELLTILLKKVRGLNRVKLIDATFVWTEPHSRRLKIKLTVQREVFASTILQQSFIIEYIVQTNQCPTCTRAQTEHTWTAVAQVRQKADHKRTFFFLEQLILKHSAHTNTLSIREMPDGIDFYFDHRSHALKFVDFVQGVVPVRFKTAEKLISHDEHSNIYNYKYTFSVEIAPICKEDLVCLPAKLASSQGNISPLVLCVKISSMVHLLDPLTLQSFELPSPGYWKYAFRSIATSKQLVPFVVLDITPLDKSNGKYQLSDVYLARDSDFGKNDQQFIAKTHLGNVLKVGDMVLGYDLINANFNDSDLESLRKSRRNLPDVILVKKIYENSRSRAAKRFWKLKELPKEEMDIVKKNEIEKRQDEYEQFLQEIEEDPELRTQINLYKKPNAEEIIKERANQMVDEDDLPEVGLEELLEDLAIDDDGEEEEEEGDAADDK